MSQREHFVAIRRAELVELLCHRPLAPPREAGQFRRLAALIGATLHHEFHDRLEALKAAYAHFDPDTDAPPRGSLGPQELAASRDELFARFDELLERANFRRLSREEICAALDAMGEWGLRVDVDFDVFERLEVYVRGGGSVGRTRRQWRDGYRRREVQVPVYRRLAVIFRLRSDCRLGRLVDPHPVYLKLFKDIPRDDLEVLLPGTRVRMSPIDQAKVWLPTVSGVAMTGGKLVQSTLAVASGGLAAMSGFLAVAGGTLGYGAKSYFGYVRTKEKYQFRLTRSLYYQNLDNNAGVLFRLLDEAEEQECREVLLAWHVLARDAGSAGLTAAELDARVERLLEDAAGLNADFEVDDALAKLLRLRIAERGPADRWRAVPAEESLRRLDAAWDAWFEPPAEASPAVRRAA
jgi:hypothetical protein